MTPAARELILAHYSAPRSLGVEWYESLAALTMLAVLAERRGITDQEFETLAGTIRAARY